MKTASAALTTLLNGQTQYWMADLYTLTLYDGTVLRWTAADVDVVVNGNRYLAPRDGGTAVPVITRGKTRVVVGLEVDELELTLGTGLGRPTSTSYRTGAFTINTGQIVIGGVPLTLAARNGLFDGATVQLDRLFGGFPGDTSAGTVTLFQGFVSGVTPSSGAVKLTVKSDLEKLNVVMPRNVYQPACSHVLFDAGCGLARASYLTTGTVSGTPTSASQFNTSVTAADYYYQNGVLIMTSGAATGARRSVKASFFASGLVQLVTALPAVPAPGDTFQIIPGCDKSSSTCTNKFANLAHFRGFPATPRPEATR